MQYAMDGKEADDPVDAQDCEAQYAAQDFQMIAQFHKGQGAINVLHIVQSWHREEIQKLPPADFNAIGRKLAEQYFPGHTFVVVTHTNTENIHNPIVVNPWQTVSGKKIENEKHNLQRLLAKSDAICKSRRLSVINEAALDRQARLPEKVQKIARFNGKSWLLDLY